MRPEPLVTTDQRGFAFRFDWGLGGLRALAPAADVVVVVDALCFTTLVSAAVESGATVVPTPGGNGAELGPTDALLLAPGARVVPPACGGHELAIAAAIDHDTVLAGCLRNASATALLARELAGPGGAIAIVAAGGAGGTGNDGGDGARPAVEDAFAAGAILAALDPSASVSAPACSPEAAAARAAFRAARPRLHEALLDCANGRTLAASGRHHDVATAAALDATALGAQLVGSEFTARTAGSGSLHQP